MNDGYFSRETPGWGTVWSAGWCCIYDAWERHRWLCSLVSRHHRLLTGSLEVGTTLGESEVKFQASAVRVGPALGSLWSPGLGSLATWLKDPCGGEGGRRVKQLRLSEKRPCCGHTSPLLGRTCVRMVNLGPGSEGQARLCVRQCRRASLFVQLWAGYHVGLSYHSWRDVRVCAGSQRRSPEQSYDTPSCCPLLLDFTPTSLLLDLSVPGPSHLVFIKSHLLGRTETGMFLYLTRDAGNWSLCSCDLFSAWRLSMLDVTKRPISQTR